MVAMHAYHLQCDSASEMQTLTLTTFAVKYNGSSGGSIFWDLGEEYFFLKI